MEQQRCNILPLLNRDSLFPSQGVTFDQRMGNPSSLVDFEITAFVQPDETSLAHQKLPVSILPPERTSDGGRSLGLHPSALPFFSLTSPPPPSISTPSGSYTFNGFEKGDRILVKPLLLRTMPHQVAR